MLADHRQTITHAAHSGPHLEALAVLLEAVALLALAALPVGQRVRALRELVREGGWVTLLDADPFRSHLLHAQQRQPCM
jgi:hypothetical protein